MRASTTTLTSLTSLSTLLLAAGLWAQRPPAAVKPAPRDALVVHEWGTFTSMQGTDGVALEGLHWEEEKLPKFVHSFSRFGQQQLVNEVGKKLSRVRRVTQKMETPVLYFHTRKPRKVRVRVGFNQGLMTQWYPIASSVRPVPAQLRPLPRGTDGVAQLPFDLSKIKHSHLEWYVELIPLADGLPEGIPPVAADDPWQFAREVRAASVRTIPPRTSKLKPQAERYLFYRGLGTFEIPMVVRSKRRGVATFRNGAVESVPFALAMEVTKDGGRVQALGKIVPRGSAAISLAETPLLPLDAFVARVHRHTIRALRAEGLYNDEATAMVRTWSRQWFTTPGNRVIYILPRRRVDQLLPLKIQPKPDELVRVLVGRLEYLTPETEDRIEDALALRLSTNPSTRQRGVDRLHSLGRFLEPKVRRILASTRSSDVRGSARQVLERLAR